MATSANERELAEQEGIAHRVARRQANQRKVAAAATKEDGQGLVELACECLTVDCERSVKVPLYVYRRMLDANDQYLLQPGHHAFAQYRTIVSVGLMRIEERA